MLSDAKLRSLKPLEKAYKVPDRDGLYVAVLKTGKISFRYNYRINGRQETLVLGQYGVGGITLAEAREKLAEAKKSLAAGNSPSRQKAREKQKLNSAGDFGTWFEAWIGRHKMAESTRDMRRSVYERDLRGPFGRSQLGEIQHTDLRALCDKIVDRGAPATAVHVREIVLMVFRFANERGDFHSNPAELIPSSSIARFEARTRSLTPEEIRLLDIYLEKVGTAPINKLAIRLLILTMVRKCELTESEWSEFNFTKRLWTIPAGRMKRRDPHNVYLSDQAMDLFIALKTCAGTSRYVLPSRYDADQPMSKATLNRVTKTVFETAMEEGMPLAPFTPHDFRRTASTMLHEAGYNSDWIEKTLAHEQRGVRSVYNRAEYADQRRAMLQDWANMVDRIRASKE